MSVEAWVPIPAANAVAEPETSLSRTGVGRTCPHASVACEHAPQGAGRRGVGSWASVVLPFYAATGNRMQGAVFLAVVGPWEPNHCISKPILNDPANPPPGTFTAPLPSLLLLPPPAGRKPPFWHSRPRRSAATVFRHDHACPRLRSATAASRGRQHRLAGPTTDEARFLPNRCAALLLESKSLDQRAFRPRAAPIEKTHRP